MPRFLIIRNPVAGWRKAGAFRHALARMEAAGCTCTVIDTATAGDGCRIVRNADENAFDAVVAAGGDGTINEVINGLSGRKFPLAILPLGTANVLAHEIGLEDDMDRAIGAAVAGNRLPVALLKAGGRYCSMMISAGFDARAVARVRPWAKQLFGKGAYYVAGAEEILAGSDTRFEVEIDGRSCDAASLVIANGRFYGGRYLCAPAANLADPTVQVVMLLRNGRWNTVRYGFAMMRGRLTDLADVKVVTGTQIRISGPAGEPFQCDGDLAGTVPVAAEVEAGAIEILVPPDSPLLSSRRPDAAAAETRDQAGC